MGPAVDVIAVDREVRRPRQRSLGGVDQGLVEIEDEQDAIFGAGAGQARFMGHPHLPFFRARSSDDCTKAQVPDSADPFRGGADIALSRTS